MIKKSAFLTGILLLAALLPACATQFSDFDQYISGGSLAPFAQDLGAIMGDDVGHSGRVLGFPGFDVGLVGAGVFSLNKDDTALKDAGVKAIGMPWVQAEVGLPFGVDAFGRGISYDGASFYGGGLRYSLFNTTSLPLTPRLLIAATGNQFTYSQFSATEYGADLIASVNAVIVEPYLGVGVDRTGVKVKEVSPADTAMLTSPITVGASDTVTEPRVTIGLNFRPMPLVYAQAAYVLSGTSGGFQSGVGIRF